jgi:hypothetical protein
VPLDAILLGIGAIVTAAGGIYISVHEFRRRERRVTRKEIEDLTDEVESLSRLLLEQRRYIYRLVTLMIDAGMNPPQPPAPSFDPGEYDNDKPDDG